MDDDPGPCSRCGALKTVNWSPVFQRFLCVTCVEMTSSEHLAEPVTALPVRDET